MIVGKQKDERWKVSQRPQRPVLSELAKPLVDFLVIEFLQRNLQRIHTVHFAASIIVLPTLLVDGLERNAFRKLPLRLFCIKQKDDHHAAC